MMRKPLFAGPASDVSSGPHELRSQLRRDVTEWIEIRLGDFSNATRIVDLSANGLRLSISQGFIPQPEHIVDLTFTDGTFRKGIVRWQMGKLFGLQLNRSIGDGIEHCDAEFLGREYFATVARLNRLAART